MAYTKIERQKYPNNGLPSQCLKIRNNNSLIPEGENLFSFFFFFLALT